MHEINEQNIRLIFGLKLRELRTDNNLSLSDLSKKTGISVSYLNEIEKGKKYPKADKIAALAEEFDVTYDWLVSLQLGRKLSPIADLIRSNILNELPLEIFGIEPIELINMLMTTPTKFNAFISTLIEIGRNYDMSVENFYYSVLRTFQEMNENYFGEIEKAADQFYTKYHISKEEILEHKHLEKILEEEFNYKISYTLQNTHNALRDLRSLLIPGKQPLLLLNKSLTTEQKAFILAKEIGYKFLDLKVREYAASLIEVDSFEKVVNNFKAGYFAGALLIREKMIIDDLKNLFSHDDYSSDRFSNIISKYHCTPEVFFHRMTNILPKHFGLKQLFFLRFSRNEVSKDISLTKEMHLAGLHNPHATALNEHYCRRWLSLTIMDELEQLKSTKEYVSPILRAQKSRYINGDNEYLLFSVAMPRTGNNSINYSISIGILINSKLRKTIKFCDDENIATRMVSETCERCSAVDCNERAASPSILNKNQKIKQMKSAIESLLSRT
ncbi:helix-turn-helix domain-containing protein [Marinigracilibium pacificum]|uniref:Helix-turn-helix domain-containing protein n=1 Tax=Marinigracilibium pacificum TaxID=2729599 RepID=A0A848J0I4_9BACT|nr:XRE family transcriptional regulator [Marinigracilibium pacificum]NMM49171.1 helix-turn-helix domain-containing protein [Marinigracilibium pacificum]